MSDDSFNPTPAADVTAQGLDIAIPKLLAEGYRFARLSDYLSDNKAVYK
jgi:peptidoglycan/xylan/chitin deacetylase (PgdA/CDA1 family)